MPITFVTLQAGSPAVDLSPIASNLKFGDLLLFVTGRAGPVAGYSMPDMTTPGFNDVYGGTIRSTGSSRTVNMRAFWKFYAPGDGIIAVPTSADSAYSHMSYLAVYRGVEPSNPFDITPVFSAGNSTAFNPQAVTPVTPGAGIVSFLLFVYQTFTHNYATVSSPYNLRVNIGTSPQLTYNLDGAHSDYLSWASGSSDYTISRGNTNLWLISTMVLRPLGASGGRVKYWNGAAFDKKPAKVWNGTAWVEKPVKFWNGTTWKATT
jgi:hypothetical protein